eukprot:Selendium_serpulae@DN5854_c0_g1_i2.p1
MNMMDEYDVNLSPEGSEASWDPAPCMPGFMKGPTTLLKQNSDYSSMYRSGTFHSQTSKHEDAEPLAETEESQYNSNVESFSAKMAKMVADLEKQQSARKWDVMMRQTGSNPKRLLIESKKRGHIFVRRPHIHDDAVSVASDAIPSEWSRRALEGRSECLAMRRRASTGGMDLRNANNAMLQPQDVVGMPSVSKMLTGRSTPAMALDVVGTELRVVLQRVRQSNAELASKYTDLEVSFMNLSHKYKNLWNDYSTLINSNGRLRSDLAEIVEENTRLSSTKFNLEANGFKTQKTQKDWIQRHNTKAFQVQQLKREVDGLMRSRDAVLKKARTHLDNDDAVSCSPSGLA